MFVFLPIPRNTKKEKQDSKSKLGPPPKEDDLVHKYRRLINLIFASQMFLVLEIIFFSPKPAIFLGGWQCVLCARTKSITKLEKLTFPKKLL